MHRIAIVAVAVRLCMDQSSRERNVMSGLIGLLLCVAMLSVVSVAFGADDAKPADAAAAGTTEVFNGKDLTGWGYKTGETFDGKTESDDKRFSAKDGTIIVNPGKGIKQLWTTAKFPKDFELRVEFRAAVNADSGLVVAGPALQGRSYLVAGR